MNRLNENIISNTARNLNQTKITRNQNIELEFTLFYQFKNNLIYTPSVKEGVCTKNIHYTGKIYGKKLNKNC